jgi:hypothetical protein
VLESAPVSRASGLLSRLNDRLFDLSLRVFTSPPAQATVNVWQSIEATGPRYQNTNPPTQFNLQAGKSIIEVVPNATKHIFEHLLGLYRSGATPQTLECAAQVRLASLQQAVSQALGVGIKHRELIKIGGWELVFAIDKGKKLPTRYDRMLWIG